MGQLNLGNGANFVGGTGGYLSDAPAGTILQKVSLKGNTSFSSTSQSYVQSPVYVTITPRSATSELLVEQCVSSWIGTGGYNFRQIRATGGYTNSDCATYGDFYDYGSSTYMTVPLTALIQNHNTTSAITFRTWGYGRGGTWYWPNNNSQTMSYKYIMTCTETAT